MNLQVYSWRSYANNMGLADGCKPIDGVLGVLSSNQWNIATFVHQMKYMCPPSDGKK